MAKQTPPANQAEIDRRRREAKCRNGRGRWKKGVLRGRAARRFKAVGTVTTRIDKASGRKRSWIKVASGQNGRKNWIPLARHAWSKAHGPIPEGAMVVHLNGKTQDDRLENLGIRTRRQVLSMNRQRDRQWEAKRKEAADRQQQASARERQGVRRRKTEVDRQRRRKKRRSIGVQTPSRLGRE